MVRHRIDGISVKFEDPYSKFDALRRLPIAPLSRYLRSLASMSFIAFMA